MVETKSHLDMRRRLDGGMLANLKIASRITTMTAPGKLLALDVGLERIGIATCDPLRLAARPLTVLQRTSRRADFEQLADLVQQEESVAVICGLPLNIDGSDGPQAERMRKWAMRLAQALRTLLGRPIPVLFWDEQLSTFEAKEQLASESGQDDDAMAAALILQRYLTAQQSSNPADFGRIELEPVV
jgi:putative Holliday junction resolvase